MMQDHYAVVLTVCLLTVRLTSGQCVDESPIPPTVPPTSWTAWYSIDDPKDGTDDETHAAIIAAHPSLCGSPTAAECRVKFLHTDHASAGQTLAIACLPGGGLLCRDSDQANLGSCLDYEIRFQCPTPADSLPDPHFYWDLSGKPSIDADEPVTCDGTVSSIYPNAGGMTGAVQGILRITDSFDSSDHLCAVRDQRQGWVQYGSANDKCISEPACCTAGFTITFWMRFRVPDTENYNKFILSTGGQTSSSRGLSIHVSNSFFMFVRGDNNRKFWILRLDEPENFPDDQWTHHCFTYDAAVGTKYYKNGVFVKHKETFNTDSAYPNNYDNVVMFTKSNNPPNSYLPDGDFSDFKMFYKNFSDAEVQTAYLKDTSASKLLIHYLRKHSHDDSFGVELECLAKAGSPPLIIWHRSDDGTYFDPVSPSADVAIYDSSPNSYRRRSILIVRHLTFSSDTVFVCEAVDTGSGGSVSKMITIQKRAMYWTPWLSADSATDGDDREILVEHQLQYDLLCKSPSGIQCRTVYDGIPFNETGQIMNINCTVSSGMECLGADQSAVHAHSCFDYEVRYWCPEPRYRWTEWYDATNPDGTMEDESWDTHGAQAYADHCSQPIGAECRIKATSQDLIASGFIPEVPYLCNANGFRCQHADNAASCPDFEVRYRCPDVSDGRIPQVESLHQTNKCSNASSYTTGPGSFLYLQTRSKTVFAVNNGAGIQFCGDKLIAPTFASDLRIDHLRPLHSSSATVVRLECSATTGKPSSESFSLKWAWLDHTLPSVAFPFVEGGAVNILMNSSLSNSQSSTLTVVDWACSKYKGKTVACFVKDGIVGSVQTVNPQAEAPPAILTESWDLSGKASPDDPDPSSCFLLSPYSFPSIRGDHQTNVIGHVNFLDAPIVVNHACAVKSDTDGALDLGGFAGECVSSPDRCTCGLTFSLWMMSFDPVIQNLTSDWFFLSSGGQSSSAHGIAFYRSATDQSFRFKLRTSKKVFDEAIVPGSEVLRGNWFHLALVYDHEKAIRVYINGNLSAAASGFQDEVKNDEKTNLVVGGANSLSGFSKAAFSDLKVYAGALNQSQINSILACNSLDVSFGITTFRQLLQPPDVALTFECKVRGIPAPTIEWEFHDRDEERKIEPDSPSVEIIAVNVTNCITKSTLIHTNAETVINELGTLVCRAKSKGHQLVRGLQVDMPSFDGDITVSLTSDVIIGETVELRCHVSGGKIYTLDWFHRRSLEDGTSYDELLVPTEGGRYNESTHVTSTTSGDYFLEIQSFSEEDIGQYVCSVNRGLGVGTIQLQGEMKRSTPSIAGSNTIGHSGTSAQTTLTPIRDPQPVTSPKQSEDEYSSTTTAQNKEIATSKMTAKTTLTSLLREGVETTAQPLKDRSTALSTPDQTADKHKETTVTMTTMEQTPSDKEILVSDDAKTLGAGITESKDSGGQDGQSDKTSKKKSNIVWLVPVGVCLAGVGIPGVIVCYYICKKKDTSIHALDLLLSSNKAAVPKPKPSKPRHDSATPMTPPKATPLPPEVRMVEVHEVIDPTDSPEPAEDNV